MGTAGTAPAHLLGWNVTENAATCPNHGICSDFNPRRNKAICGNPDAVANRDTGCHQLEGWVLDVMTAGTEVAFLGNDAVLTDMNAVKAV